MYSLLIKTFSKGKVINENLEVGDDYLTFKTKEEAEQFKVYCMAKLNSYAEKGLNFYEYCQDTDSEPEIDLYTAVLQVVGENYSLNLVTLIFLVLSKKVNIDNFFEIIEEV